MALTPQETIEVQRNVKSLPRAVEMMCKHCVYDVQIPECWRKQVEDCTNQTCPLFNFRPCVAGEARKHGMCASKTSNTRLRLLE